MDELLQRMIETCDEILEDIRCLKELLLNPPEEETDVDKTDE